MLEGRGERRGGRYTYTHSVVVRAVDVARHAEVGYLHHQLVPDQAVARGHVAVHEVLRRHVHHARGDLLGDEQELVDRQRQQRRVLAETQALCVRTPTPGKDTRPIDSRKKLDPSST